MPLKSLSKVSVGASRFNRLPNGFKRSSKLTQTMPIDGDNVASIRVVIGTTAVGTGVFNRSATAGLTIGVSASGQQTDQQHFGTATVGVVISSTASASVTSIHSGTATASIVITTTAAGETGATHAGTAGIGITISASSSGTVVSPVEGVASCQVNLSVSAAGFGFDPSNQVPDESGNDNTMTLVSSPSFSTTPSFSTDAAIGSRSVDFDRSSDHGATVPSTYEDVLDSPFTFSAWLKPNDGQTTQTSYIFHSSGEFKRASGTSEWTFQVYTHQSGDIVAGFQYWNGTSSLFRRRQTLNPAFSDGAQSSWTHLAVTVDSTCTPIIYINGSSVTVANNGNDTLSLSNFFSVDSFASIGSYGSVNVLGQYVPAFEYDGKLDDISIWSTALTSTQISNLYNSGNGTDLTGSSNLAAWWKMGDSNIVTHSGTANIGVTISSTASGTASQTHTGTASCQVNLSASASGFNTSTTVPDETSNGNNMTLYADGSGTKYAYSSDAAIGTRSVEFEGSATTDGTGGYGIIDNTFQSVFRSSFSVSAWVKLDDGDVNYNWILGNYPSGGASGSNYVALYFMGGDPRFTYRAGSVGKLVWDQDYDLANGQSGWIHLVGTYNATDDSMYLYVNGTEAASDTTSTDPTQYTNSVNLRVNKYEDSNANYIYTGKKIDDISIWSKALSSTEVSNLYNSGSGTSLTGSSDLEGWWKMGDHSVLPVTHSGTATVSVGVTASASGTAFTTHSGTASCQVNLSASASGSSVTPAAYSNNYSIELDGTNQYLSVSDHNDFSFGNSTTDSAFSVAAWIKMDDATKFRIFSKQTNSSNIEYVFGVDGLDRLGVNLYDGATSNYRGVYSSSIQSHEGSWIHVAMTYDGTGGSTAYNGMKLYLNGSALSTSNNSGGGYTAMHNTTTDVWIGGANFVPDYANGKIDEVAVFSAELTSTQVSNIYNSGTPTNLSSESNLVGYWRMEENTGTTVADSSGNGHTATLNNSPTFSTDVPSSSSSGFTISTFNTETNILASTPSNGTVAYGTDTESYYVYDSSLGWAEFIPS